MNLSYNQFFLRISSLLFSVKVGVDAYNNSYFTSKKKSIANNNRKRRWVIYAGEVEASKVPAEWNAWLHHVTDQIPKNNIRKPTWIKKHLPNMTGTEKSNNYKSVKQKNKVENKYSLWDPNE